MKVKRVSSDGDRSAVCHGDGGEWISVVGFSKHGQDVSIMEIKSISMDRDGTAVGDIDFCSRQPGGVRERNAQRADPGAGQNQESCFFHRSPPSDEFLSLGETGVKLFEV